jgi:hypothetical protein
VTHRLRVREIDDDEGRRLLRIVRRGRGSVVTWRRAQMVLLSAQGMDVAAIARVAFTSEDRVRDVIGNFNADGFSSLYPSLRSSTAGIRRYPALATSACGTLRMAVHSRLHDWDDRSLRHHRPEAPQAIRLDSAVCPTHALSDARRGAGLSSAAARIRRIVPSPTAGTPASRSAA